jgi:ectoine hydroxylase-related dioxygenase (phytanoyl-CoA dioxygenase family)
MIDHLRIDPNAIPPVPDPDTGGQLRVHPDAFGQAGVPFIIQVTDPPNTTRPRHHHHGDVCYLYVAGEHHIEGEGTYRAGDVRWTRAGHVYGPETTGPDGGTWWIISSANPIPVDHVEDTATASARPAATDEVAELERVPADLPIDELVELTTDPGAVIVEGLLDPALLTRVNADIDDWLTRHPGDGTPASGNELYDLFLGTRTIRLHGLLAKLPMSGRDLIAAAPIVHWAERVLARSASSILLNADEVIQIGPGEPAQYLHRDSDSWPALAAGGDPFIVNAIVALGEVTAENGGTVVAPGSHRWVPGRLPRAHEVATATMHPGDALLFRGDLLHGGGANTTTRPRRAVSLSYCSGWLRPVENHLANLGIARVLACDPIVRGLLGAGTHDATSRGGGLLGLIDGRSPELKCT